MKYYKSYRLQNDCYMAKNDFILTSIVQVSSPGTRPLPWGLVATAISSPCKAATKILADGFPIHHFTGFVSDSKGEECNVLSVPSLLTIWTSSVPSLKNNFRLLLSRRPLCHNIDVIIWIFYYTLDNNEEGAIGTVIGRISL